MLEIGVGVVVGILIILILGFRRPRKLEQILKTFYRKEVCIAEKELRFAKGQVDVVIDNLKLKLKDLFSEKYGINLKDDWVKTGSAFEGLKVKAPDEFEVFVELDIWHDQSALFVISQVASADMSGYDFIKVSGGSGSLSEMVLGEGTVFHAQKVLHGFQSVLQKAVSDNDDEKQMLTEMDGTTLKVVWNYKNKRGRNKTIKIELIPCVCSNKRYYIAKPDIFDEKEGTIGKWKIALLDKHQQKMKNVTEKKRRVLKLALGFCKKDENLAWINQIHLKTVFLHMLDMVPGAWKETDDYFKLLLEYLLDYLREGNLPDYFVPKRNLFLNFAQAHPQTMENASARLRFILRSGNDEIIRVIKGPSNRWLWVKREYRAQMMPLRKSADLSIWQK
ncbi:cyclic GMP-AMP synthase-like receptor 3 [Ptychodera flava]|uniref:cyclic GMP-AMP synthase-like receptor 3 n=1 Tax=Ptychodera flava TaxID=63121 RepID=UPI00396A2A12